ncbi:putative exon 1 of metallothionein-like, partial [Hyalella azteca]
PHPCCNPKQASMDVG